MCKEITEKTTGKSIIMGDFNFPGINWETYASSKYSEVFRDMCLDNFLHQVFEENTRGSNILDLVLVSHLNLVSDVTVIEPLAGSDYNIVKFSLNANITSIAKDVQKLNLNRANFHNMRLKLQNVEWDAELDHRNAQESWKFFTQLMQKHYQ